VCALGPTKEMYKISAPQEHPHGGNTDTERTISFSDAVIAIAITLLALDLKVPQVPESSAAAELPRALLELWPNLFSFALSFWIIGSYWLAHRRTSELVGAYDQRMQLINLLFLMWIVLMPFSTALVGEYEHQQLPVIIYAVHNILTSLTLTWLWRHAIRDSRLVEANLDPRLVGHSHFRSLVVQSVFVLSIGISFISVDVARLSWVLIWPLTGPVLQRYV
jgi:TMEM175 potassium channel family protein